MIRLMKLELKKVSLKKYILLSILGIFISMFFIFVGLNDTSTSIYDYDVTFRMVGLIFCFYYITLFSVMVVTYIINEYSHKTILVMFSYPLDRRKLILAKLLLVLLLVFCSMLLGYVCCGGFIILVDRYLHLVTGEFELSVLHRWIPAACKAMLTFCGLGTWSFVVGMLKKSVPMTIISAILFGYLRQFFLAGTNSTEESWSFVLAVVFTAVFGVYFVLARKVRLEE